MSRRRDLWGEKIVFVVFCKAEVSRLIDLACDNMYKEKKIKLFFTDYIISQITKHNIKDVVNKNTHIIG